MGKLYSILQISFPFFIVHLALTIDPKTGALLSKIPVKCFHTDSHKGTCLYLSACKDVYKTVSNQHYYHD